MTHLNGKLDRAREATEIARLKAEAAALKVRTRAINRLGGRMAAGEPGIGYGNSSWGVGGRGDFDSARRSRLKSGGVVRGGSADSHRDRSTLDEIRTQCQSLARNDHLVQGLITRLQDLTVGEAIRVQVKSEDAAYNRAVEKWALGWMSGACDFDAYMRVDGLSCGRSVAEMCRLALGAYETDGDLFAVLTETGQVQLVEAERCRTPWGRDGAGIVNGVEKDAAGRVVAYRFSSWDATTGGAYPEVKTTRVPAEFVLHLRAEATGGGESVNSTRPEPGLNALLDPLQLLREYKEDTAAAAKIALLFGLITKTEHPQDFGLQIPGSDQSKTTQGDGTSYTQREVEMEPAFVAHLQPGESVEQVKPEHPTTVFGDYVKNVMTMLGATKGLPLVLWLLDFGGLNFSSAKSAVLLAYIGIRVRRAGLVRRFLRPLFRWRLAMALRKGEVVDDDGEPVAAVPMGWDQIEFFFPPMPVLDPSVQYDAMIKAINGRLMSHADAVKELNGYEYEEFLDQIEYEQDELRERDIQMVGMPGQVMGGGGADQSANGKAQSANEGKTEPEDTGDPEGAGDQVDPEEPDEMGGD